MTAPRPTISRVALAGPLLVLVGLACWALYVKQSRSQPHAYSHGANPPSYVRLLAGQTYWISVRGGVARVAELGIDPTALHCTAARTGETPGAVQLVTETSDTKENDRIASFVSTVSGQVQIRCDGIGAVYVDNAADAPYDWSGFWLVLTSITLAVGLPLTLSFLRRVSVNGASFALDDDDEVE